MSNLSVDTEKLRQKVLDLAMRGKLVPQDKNDEPASVLLEKIQTEKAQLIKEKKIKKTKLLDLQDIDVKFPDTWKLVQLGDLFEIKGGKRVPKGKKLSKSGVKVYIRVSDMKQGTVDLKDSHYADEETLESIKNYTISSKDLYFSIAGTIGKVGKVPEDLDGALLTENAAKLVTIEENATLKNYMYYCLQSKFIKEQCNKIISQVAQPKLSLIKLRSLAIPLPPLSEQQRIVDKIEECMQAIKTIEDSSKEYENLQNQLDKKVLDSAMRGKLLPQDENDEPASVLLDKIKAEKAQLIKEKKIKKSKALPAIMDEEKPFATPESWEWVRLGEISSILSGRDLPKRQHLSIEKNGSIPYITGASNIDNGIISYRTWTDEPITIAKKGDILLTVKGTIGKIAILNEQRAHIARQIMAISSFSSVLLNDYIKLFLVWYVNELKTKAKSMIPGVTKDDVSLSLIPLPPLAEQQRIVAKIEEIKQYLV
ncbi:hypothetical protein GTO87_05330 [Ligilactobacillus saerimneri]|uniref:Type I restriction modification DNA specificity domain-containing protein n=1 Tax=Ligilactobacillus saerimneri TaxID=228229 RepID=A0A7H9EK90_9LACO|nr:restriction endonuclease subunit S [Ligilactobacillus saerimneri]QLL78074.1 hypothetical protein GTO87_05330 [Ligilactobacillus saerimneri]